MIEERRNDERAQMRIGARRIVSGRLDVSHELVPVCGSDIAAGELGQRRGKIVGIGVRAVEPEFDQDPPVRSVPGRDAGSELCLRVGQKPGNRTGACNDLLPLRVGSVFGIPGGSHSLDLPVDTPEWAVDVRVERALLISTNVVLMQQKADLGQRHGAINTPPR